MTEIQIKDLEENPRSFFFSAPERCPPCKMIKNSFSDKDMDWVHIDQNIEEIVKFRMDHDLEFRTIPAFIKYDGEYSVGTAQELIDTLVAL